jgi:hypothetical protein
MRFIDDIDGKYPKFKKKILVNKHLTRYRFSSRIHLNEWEKIKNSLETLFLREIYRFENSDGNREITDICVIENELPTYIEWRNDFIQDGRVFAIGASYATTINWDAASEPHLLLAGATKMGKSTIVISIIYQALLKGYSVYISETVKHGSDFIGLTCDSQGGERGRVELLTTPEQVRTFLRDLVSTVDTRMEECSSVGVSNVDVLNEYRQAKGLPPHEPIMAVFDELAELLDAGKPSNREEAAMYDQINTNLRKLARTSRSANVNLLLSLIRPSADIVSGSIKNQTIFRICGYYPDSPASRIMLEDDRACALPPKTKGRFICRCGNDIDEFQAYYISPPDISEVSTKEGQIL